MGGTRAEKDFMFQFIKPYSEEEKETTAPLTNLLLHSSLLYSLTKRELTQKVFLFDFFTSSSSLPSPLLFALSLSLSLFFYFLLYPLSPRIRYPAFTARKYR